MFTATLIFYVFFIPEAGTCTCQRDKLAIIKIVQKTEYNKVHTPAVDINYTYYNDRKSKKKRTGRNANNSASQTQWNRIAFTNVHHSVKQLIGCQRIRHWVSLSIEWLSKTLTRHTTAVIIKKIITINGDGECRHYSCLKTNLWLKLTGLVQRLMAAWRCAVIIM